MPPDSLVEILGRWSGTDAAPRVKTLPPLVTEADLSEMRAGSIGIAEHDTAGWSPDLFGHSPHFVVLGDGESGKTTTLRGLIRSLERTRPPGEAKIGVIDYRRRLTADVSRPFAFGHASTPEEAHALVSRIVSELGTRSITDQG